MTSDSEWSRDNGGVRSTWDVEGCGPHSGGMKGRNLGIVMASGHGWTRGWLRRKEQLRGVISAPKACAEMRAMAHFKGRKAKAIERAGTKAQRRNHRGSRVPQVSWI